uniref:Follistatin-like domain-containing protein n=1 Tax=Acrobeloides nanus TaxID=290746 RepID=A0A914E574_9BILA
MCGINEESRPCNTCELTCEDPMGQHCYSKPECVGNTCQCKDGFYRNSVGKCVRRWRCYESGHPRPVTRTNLTCDNVQCDDGYDCVTINPICASLRVPCDTTPKVLCLPRNGTNLPALPLTCDNFKCAIDEICVMLKQCYSLHISCDVEPKPKCIKQISTTTLTCDNFQCGEKETCVMKAPMCPSLRVECDTRPKPQCIPSSNLPSCDSFPCGTNEQCVMKTPICPSLRANCIKVPQPQCVPLDSNTA